VADDAVPWIPAADGVVLTVRLTPRGGRDAIDGIDHTSDGRPVLKVRVRAAPTEGEANAALAEMIAGALGVSRRALTLVSGKTQRVKRMKISGDAAALSARLQQVSRVKA